MATLALLSSGIMGISNIQDRPTDLKLTWWKLSLTGLVAGCMATTFGIGGGVLMVPVMGIWLGVPIKKAVGTSLITIFGITLIGTITESIKYPDHIVWEYSAMIAGGSILGVTIGKKLNAKAHDWLLKLIFSGLLFFAASKFLGLIHFGGGEDQAIFQILLNRFELSADTSAALGLRLALALGLGVFAGVASASLGSGGGFIYIPGLIFLFSMFSSDAHPARATSLAAVVITSGWGGFLHSRAGNLIPSALKSMLPFAMVGAVGGVFVASLIERERLLEYFAILLIILATQMLSSFWQEIRHNKTQTNTNKI